jgi:hypothetical protein
MLGNPGKLLAERWNGGRWSVQQAIDVASGATPEGVSCGSPRVCTIVGISYTGGLVLRLADGSTQLESVAPAPGNTPYIDLYGVSCVDRTCMAVGAYPDAAGMSQTLAEQYR